MLGRVVGLSYNPALSSHLLCGGSSLQVKLSGMHASRSARPKAEVGRESLFLHKQRTRSPEDIAPGPDWPLRPLRVTCVTRGGSSASSIPTHALFYSLLPSLCVPVEQEGTV